MKTIKKVRLLMLASGDLWAGAEVMLYQLVSGIVNNNSIDLFVVLLNRGKLATELESLGVNVKLIDETNISFTKSIGYVRELVKTFAPNIIHSHRYKENLLAWCASRGFPDCKLVATQHGMSEVRGKISKKDGLRNWLIFRLLSAGFTKTVVVSEEMQRSLVGRYGLAKQAVVVIHNGIRVPEDVIAQPRGRVVIGSAGRLFPVKDFSLLVDVAQTMVQNNDTVDFVLAGDGPERAMLEERVGRYGMTERFKFLGHQEDMVTFYTGLDLYINTSVHEGLPMSVLEAMSYGVPSIVPKVGGFPEIIENGVDGILVENRNSEMFAHRILPLLDPGVRSIIGRAAKRKIVASFSQEVMTQHYCQLYKELVEY